MSLLLFFFLILFIYLFIIFGCVGSSPLCEGFLQLRRVGATLHRGARVSHCRGLSRCGAQAPDAQAQQLWLTGPVAPWHVGSSQTRARTRVPCIGRQILNHCATREAPQSTFIVVSINGSSKVSPVLWKTCKGELYPPFSLKIIFRMVVLLLLCNGSHILCFKANFQCGTSNSWYFL